MCFSSLGLKIALNILIIISLKSTSTTYRDDGFSIDTEIVFFFKLFNKHLLKISYTYILNFPGRVFCKEPFCSWNSDFTFKVTAMIF